MGRYTVADPIPRRQHPSFASQNDMQRTPFDFRPSTLGSDGEERRHLPDDTLESVLVPLDGLDLVDAVGSTNSGLGTTTAGNTLTGAGPRKHVSIRKSMGRKMGAKATYMQQ